MSHISIKVSHRKSDNAGTAKSASARGGWWIEESPVTAIRQNFSVQCPDSTSIAARLGTEYVHRTEAGVGGGTVLVLQTAAMQRHFAAKPEQPAEDEYGAARGIVIALAISLPFWALILGITWVLMN